MIRFALRVDGLTEATAAMAQLPVEFRAEAIRSIDEGSALIEVEYRARVPVGDAIAGRYAKDRTPGELKRSIGRNVREDGLQAAVGSGSPRAKWVEFATEDTPAQPALRPAYRRGVRLIRQQMKEWGARAGQRVRVRSRRRYRGPAPKVAP